MLALAPLSPSKLLNRFNRWSSNNGKAFASVQSEVGTDQEQLILDYICCGPLLETCGFTPSGVKADLGTWVALGNRIIANLGFPAFDQLDDTQRLRVFHYYLPVFLWAKAQLAAHKARFAPGTAPALVLGVSAPQGCGKSTLCEQLVELFEHIGCTAASVSVDDFYLTYEGQTALANNNPTNALLQYRGNAGSHDLPLGVETLTALTAHPAAAGTVVPLPRYNKSAYGGRGDRAARDAWPSVSLPVDIVLFEGWMLGFRPQPEVGAITPDLVPVNDALTAYEGAWDRFVNAWLVIRVSDPTYVYDWRLQAEIRMRASGKAGMTDEQIKDFVDRYIPAYKAYLPSLYSEGPTTAQPGSLLVVEVDQQRAPVAQQPAKIM